MQDALFWHIYGIFFCSIIITGFSSGWRSMIIFVITFLVPDTLKFYANTPIGIKYAHQPNSAIVPPLAISVKYASFGTPHLL